MSGWIEHVKKVAKDKGLSYKEAMSVAKKSYKPKDNTKKDTKNMKKDKDMKGMKKVKK